jgi:hypothetical protein
MITGVSYLSMKEMMKGYAIIMNNSVANGLTKTYTYDRLREDKEDNSFKCCFYSKENASSGKRLRQRLFFREGFPNYHYKTMYVCQLFKLEGSAVGILGRECDCVGVTVYS